MTDTPSVLLLDLRADSARLIGPGGDVQAIGIGAQSFAAYARHGIPMSAAGMEAAIAQIEDALMPLARRWHGLTGLRVLGEGMLDLMAACHDDGDRVPLAVVEATFNAVAAVAQGRPVATAPLPLTSAAWTACLLVRELMHHLGVLWVQGPPRAA